MSSSNESTKHRCCSQLSSTNSYHCSHCLASFCLDCLIEHHHHHVKYEFADMINRIDKILAQFLHHAHNQTEWTNHLTDDRNRLELYIQYIEKYHKHLPITALPSFQWVNHIQDLIKKKSFAINENCCKLMYPSNCLLNNK